MKFTTIAFIVSSISYIQCTQQQIKSNDTSSDANVIQPPALTPNTRVNVVNHPPYGEHKSVKVSAKAAITTGRPKHAPPRKHNRVADGSVTPIDYYAWAAYILWNHTVARREGYSYVGPIDLAYSAIHCSGVLIAPAWVVTAAACFDRHIREVKTPTWEVVQPYGGWVRVGPHGEEKQVRDMRRVFWHHSYVRQSTSSNVDAALVLLDKEVTDIDLPKFYGGLAPYVDNDNDTLIVGYVVGFGESGPGDKDETLYKTDPVRESHFFKSAVGDKAYCQHLHNIIFGKTPEYDSFYVCGPSYGDYGEKAGRACQGDLGAGLDSKGELAGIVSVRVEKEQCGGDKWFTTYVNVGHPLVHGWISNFTGMWHLAVTARSDDERSTGETETESVVKSSGLKRVVGVMCVVLVSFAMMTA